MNGIFIGHIADVAPGFDTGFFIRGQPDSTRSCFISLKTIFAPASRYAVAIAEPNTVRCTGNER